MEPLALQRSVDVAHVAQVGTAFGGGCPRLDQLEHLVLDVLVGRDGGGSLEQRRHVVEELSRRYLLYEVGAAVLDARVGELAAELTGPCCGNQAAVPYIESSELDVWVLVPDAALQRAHGIFRLHCLGPNHVGDFEVEGHVLAAQH